MRVLGATVAALALMASTAHAATLEATLDYIGFSSQHYFVDYKYTGGGEANNLVITHNPGSPLRETFTDFGAPLIVGPLNPVGLMGLPIVGVAANPAYVCVPGLLLVTCINQTGYSEFRANLGNGNDRGRLDGPEFLTLDGGAGNDILGGGSGSEYMPTNPGADRFYAGAGNDVVVYAAAGAAVTVSLDGAANDGLAGEGDNVAPDMDFIDLGSFGDTFVGSDSAQDVRPFNGPDQVDTRGGNDTIRLENDGVADQITCGAGNDKVLRSTPDPLDTIAPDCEVVS